MVTKELLDLMGKRLDAANNALRDACNNGFQLKASIPANPKSDHDLIIGDSLNDLRFALGEFQMVLDKETPTPEANGAE